MSLLFGKRFDNHGMTEGSGYFKLPDFSNLAMRCLHTLPHNSHKPRVDYPVLLDFKQLSRIAPLVNFTFADSTSLDIARTSIKFYAQALRRVESDPEAAYLDLVTCGEVLSSAANYDAEILLGREMVDILELMRSQLPDGDRLARMVGSRMRGIKRAFVKTLTDRLPTDFFSHRESLPEGYSLQADDIEKRVAAAYDLRSLHLHTGAPFGAWVAPRYRSNDEIQGGAPVVPSESLAKALKLAPTFVGLERITRSCLLNFLSDCGVLTAGDSLE